MDQIEATERNDNVNPAPTTLTGWFAQHAVSLIIMAAVIVFVCVKLEPLTVAMVALGLGLVIFIHELGHFLAAKWCDVHVETFSIGFGPALPGCRFQRGETTYQVALVPLGGYVKMVGEGSEDEGEDDPRSFKNKTVGQRMLIISAGVIMNILLAGACFIGVYMTTGVDRPAGVIGSVDAGSPSWQKGLRPGVKLVRMGDTENPYFDDVMPEVMHWKPGQPIPVEYESYENGKTKVVKTEIVPRKNKERGRPMIGIAPAFTASLIPPNRKHLPPYVPETAAAAAQPPLKNGDQIVGTTDPNQPANDYQPTRLSPLPDDPRSPGTDRKDYFELARRLHRLAGKDMIVQVKREGASSGAKPDEVRVAPAFHTTYGLRLGMGPILAIREGSPAENAGIQPGDTLIGVEVVENDGAKVRFVSNLSQPPNQEVREEILDPARLPDMLTQWAARRDSGPKSVTLTVVRPDKKHNLTGKVEQVTVPWDDSWRDEPSAPSSEVSPQAIDGLGLAYAIKAKIEEVVKSEFTKGEKPSSPAERGIVTKEGKDGSPAKGASLALQKGDVIKAVRFYGSGDGAIKEREIEIGPDQGAFLLWMAQEASRDRKMGLVIQRGEDQTFEVQLTGEEDKSWPQAARGFGFEPDLRLEKADSLAQALSMGVRYTGRLIGRIYQNLAAMLDGRISFTKNASGPISIAAVSYDIAGENLQLFVLFIGMISVNLAVINFLPIPVLDGGHMVFLIYEKLRGRPAPEAIRVAATFVGLAMIASLMLFVIFLDVQKRL